MFLSFLVHSHSTYLQRTVVIHSNSNLCTPLTKIVSSIFMTFFTLFPRMILSTAPHTPLTKVGPSNAVLYSQQPPHSNRPIHFYDIFHIHPTHHQSVSSHFLCSTHTAGQNALSFPHNLHTSLTKLTQTILRLDFTHPSCQPGSILFLCCIPLHIPPLTKMALSMPKLYSTYPSYNSG